MDIPKQLGKLCVWSFLLVMNIFKLIFKSIMWILVGITKFGLYIMYSMSLLMATLSKYTLEIMSKKNNVLRENNENS